MNHLTQSIFTLFIAAVTTLGACAQSDKASRPSPPAQAEATVDGTTVTIDYSQPSVKGRKIFGELEPYGKVWRTGANEATTFEVSSDVTIEGQALPKGKYALFTIPQENEDWTVIFNKTAEQWGAYDYDESQDALRVQVSPEKSSSMTEKLTFDIAESGEVTFMWADTKLSFDVASAGQASN
ncbi:MAG: DUF2911 domain-containing protein [Cyclobacteriaceae bacterium]